MRRIIVIALAAITLIINATSGDQTSEPLSVRIVPSWHHEKYGRRIQFYQPSQHFMVVVTNVSNQALNLWSERCSWGYDNLSFEITGEDGRAVKVTKKPRGWDSNYPMPIFVPPGDHMVYEVSFDPEIWENSPLIGLKNLKAVKMRAIFEIGQEERSEEKKVWTGRVTSPTESYTLMK